METKESLELLEFEKFDIVQIENSNQVIGGEDIPTGGDTFPTLG